jgi:DNA invertase Pin-like site-specific DNA recombinase
MHVIVYSRAESQGFASRQRQQRDSVSKLSSLGDIKVLKWITEIELGRTPKWPELKRAANEAHKLNAVLVVVGLNRFAREVELLNQLDAMIKGGSFSDGLLFADLPELGIISQANPSAFSLLAAVATYESRFDRERRRYHHVQTSSKSNKHGGLRPSTQLRNKRSQDAAIAASEKLREFLVPLFQERATYREMGKALHKHGFKTRRGEALSPSQIRRHLQRLGLKT